MIRQVVDGHCVHCSHSSQLLETDGSAERRPTIRQRAVARYFISSTERLRLISRVILR